MTSDFNMDSADKPWSVEGCGLQRSDTLGPVGLGLRREFLDEFIARDPADIPANFIEIAPENWVGVGGARAKKLAMATSYFPLVCHGLSLSIGSPAPLDVDFIAQLKAFLDQHQVICYSEHLSYCSDQQGQLYDLLPIPFTEEAVHWVAGRIREVQSRLERCLVIENVSYYCAPHAELSEIEFLLAVLAEADCELLLDVNNIYVNSINHGYDASAFLQQIPAERIAYLHIAGHYQQQPDLLIDTHGAPIIDPVWQLLDETYQRFGVLPTLLERDNDVPELAVLCEELRHIARIAAPYTAAVEVVNG